jgi:EF hand domain-containing protein
MRRRDFITLLGGAAAAWPLAAWAQQPAKLPTIGYLGSATPATQGHLVAAFVRRLRELGWIEGRTIAIEYRWAEGRTERAAEIAAEFVRRKVEVIVTSGTAVRPCGVDTDRGASLRRFKMQKRVLVLTTSAFILACGAIAASAQQGPLTQQPQILQQQQEQEHQLQGVQTPRRAVHDDIEDDGGMMGWGYGPSWRHYQGWGRGMGMMGRGGMMGPGSMHSGMMMRMLFAMMDNDGDGTISLQEFQAAHERIFKAMDANKDGRLTLEEIQAFMQGARGSVPRQ